MIMSHVCVTLNAGYAFASTNRAQLINEHFTAFWLEKIGFITIQITGCNCRKRLEN